MRRLLATLLLLTTVPLLAQTKPIHGFTDAAKQQPHIGGRV
jgi:hypothetical protein